MASAKKPTPRAAGSTSSSAPSELRRSRSTSRTPRAASREAAPEPVIEGAGKPKAVTEDSGKPSKAVTEGSGKPSKVTEGAGKPSKAAAPVGAPTSRRRAKPTAPGVPAQLDATPTSIASLEAATPTSDTSPAASESSPAASVAPAENASAATRDAWLRKRAYLLAESNHFAGDPLFYWRVAERELVWSARLGVPLAVDASESP